VTAAPRLTILRNFSSILTHSLNAEGMLRQFLLQLRDIVSLNRAAIFLRPNYSPFQGPPTPEESRRLRTAERHRAWRRDCWSTLNFRWIRALAGNSSGWGGSCAGAVTKCARIWKRKRNLKCSGRRWPCPIFDRDSLLGVAVFDGRITGRTADQCGTGTDFPSARTSGAGGAQHLVARPIDRQSRDDGGVLRELNSACVVVSRDLKILHANKMARKYFNQTARMNGEMEFTDLPQALGAKIYQVLRSGSAIAPFKYEPEGAPGTIYTVTVAPFHKAGCGRPTSALLVLDDQTQSEQLRKLEVEAPTCAW
jgi:PAS domain-containing protein